MGLFGVVTKRKNMIEDLLLGIDYHSHLFTEKAGLATFDPDYGFDYMTDSIKGSQFKAVFYPKVGDLYGGKYGIGVISGSDYQPIVFQTPLGDFALCMNGLVSNEEEVFRSMLREKRVLSRTEGNSLNQVELIANLIGRESTYSDGLLRLHDHIYGSTSLLLMNENGIYAFSDKFPLTVGRRDDDWAIASESSAFPNIGFETYRFLSPGTAVRIDENGVEELGKVDDLDICTFLWIYTAFPSSSFDGVNVEETRYRSGEKLAEKHPVEDADLVSGVPDSGTAYAVGFSRSGTPYHRALIKYTPGYGRSYTPPSQKVRDRIASKKLIPVWDIIREKSMVITEDSIVRGTQLGNIVDMIWDRNRSGEPQGAREIHGRVGSSPLIHPCPYNISTRKPGELAAVRAIRAIEGDNNPDLTPYLDTTSRQYEEMIDWIRQDLGLTSLAYQTPQDMVEAISLPPEKLCMYCWMGSRTHERK